MYKRKNINEIPYDNENIKENPDNKKKNKTDTLSPYENISTISKNVTVEFCYKITCSTNKINLNSPFLFCGNEKDTKMYFATLSKICKTSHTTVTNISSDTINIIEYTKTYNYGQTNNGKYNTLLHYIGYIINAYARDSLILSMYDNEDFVWTNKKIDNKTLENTRSYFLSLGYTINISDENKIGITWLSTIPNEYEWYVSDTIRNDNEYIFNIDNKQYTYIYNSAKHNYIKYKQKYILLKKMMENLHITN